MNEDTRNMVLAIALSIFVLIGWQVLQPVFFPPPPAPPVVERFVHIEDVGGSNPSSPTIATRPPG
jgi:hypothetical protein